MAIFKGAGVALVTPFTEDYEVNYPKLAELIEFHIANGTDAIIITGTTGESSTLSEEEHSAVIRFTVEKVNKRIPVIAGTGSNSTQTAIQLSKGAQEDGADALLLVTPYYNKATQKGLIEHYTAIANAVSLPIILYNVPSRTGCNILPETAAYLADHVENIVAIKEACDNISQITRLASLVDGKLDIYSGSDDITLPILSVGGIGSISVLSNIAPQKAHDIVASFLEGDNETSRKLQLEANDVIGALFCEVNPIPVKHALNLMGFEVGPLRRPLCEMEPANLERLKKAMENYGVL
jgi:4-hydroxy-tetrahydrodipicolinate synthase